MVAGTGVRETRPSRPGHRRGAPVTTPSPEGTAAATGLAQSSGRHLAAGLGRVVREVTGTLDHRKAAVAGRRGINIQRAAARHPGPMVLPSTARYSVMTPSRAS